MTECSSLDTRPETSAFRRWLAVFSLACGTFALVNTEFLPIGLLSPIAQSLGITEGHAGLAVMLPGLVAAISAPLIMLFARKMDRRTLLLLLSATVIVANGIAVLAQSFNILLIGRIILGIGVGGFWSFAIPSGRRLVSEEQGARAISLITAGVAVGTVAGVPAGAFIGDLFGWRMAFTLNAVLALAFFVLQWVALPSLPAQQSIGLRAMLGVTKVAGIRYALIIGVFMAGGHFAAYTYLEPWLRFNLHLSAGNISLLLMGYGVAGLLGTLTSEITVREFGVKKAFMLNMLLLSVSVLVLSLFPVPLALACVLVILWGLAFGALPVCLNIWTYQASPALFETGSALLVCVFQTSLALGALSGGILADHAGVSSAFLLGGVLTLLAGITIFLSRPQPAVLQAAGE
ncbi:MFS transporter [Rahnella sp. SL6]|uniref:MFS transporter n=2 Tax=Rahnella perminowiae TaxID=2816244 RepID=A0ABS6L3A1_9GAMM|nr:MULTISPECIES: MFS transporter [Rahnella]UJD92036.1 MFS transporter [Rahnella aquatilis]MBU9809723.1 MFS transporter [Rahnella perminowiae]MBU9825177.1 MFS transporter [Rahnella perminowiae]MBU9836333.1 MFS transporter [Rahnella perminowiae]MCR9003572.1 MFS transporter [Rahnella perminowiae]